MKKAVGIRATASFGTGFTGALSDSAGADQ